MEKFSLQKGNPIYKKSCKKCGSSDANQVFSYDQKPNDSYCFACETYFPSDDGLDKVVPIKQYNKAQTMEIEDIKKLPIRALEDRKIRKETCAAYRVRVAVSEEDGETITSIFSPDTSEGILVGYEQKQVKDKRFISIGDRKGSLDLWGKHHASKCGGQKLYITEGRLDALSLYQVIIDQTPDKFKDNKPSCVSLTKGCSSAVKDLINNRSFLENYKDVILCFDGDEPGRKATKEVLKIFPTFKVADIPLKDCSDMLVADRARELYDKVVWRSTVQRQGEVVEVNDELIKKALQRPTKGLSTCWATLDAITHNGILRPNNIVVLASYPKGGKSEFKNQLVKHIIIEHNRPVGVYDLEVHPIKTLKQIASKLARTNFLLPDNNYDDRLLASTLDRFKGNLFLYDRTGSRDWQDIKACIIEQHLIDGVCEFFLDPLTALISRYTSSEANDKLNEIMTDLADLVNCYPITILCFSHVNPPSKGNKSHEEGGKVLSGQMTGSRAIEKWSHIGLGLERDRSADCPPEKVNHSQVKILYDREFGTSGSVDMFYDSETTEYLEPKTRSW
tara:strand:+ start:4742 stop:6427 length:1686 start_codon:yes stop_codon:yes gene_type:complete